MSDAKLRELERRWKETGAVEDQAAYLLERVRVGDLEREKLELAAYCGHGPAQLALGPGPEIPAYGCRGWVEITELPDRVGLARVVSAFSATALQALNALPEGDLPVSERIADVGALRRAWDTRGEGGIQPGLLRPGVALGDLATDTWGREQLDPYVQTCWLVDHLAASLLLVQVSIPPNRALVGAWAAAKRALNCSDEQLASAIGTEVARTLLLR